VARLDIYGKLDPAKASPAEVRGQEIFFGKGQCAACHTPPYYTDNTMHNLQVERFYRPEMINGMLASGADQDLSATRHQGIATLPARRAALDVG
jgi:cytochrome c peroxidase